MRFLPLSSFRTSLAVASQDIGISDYDAHGLRPGGCELQDHHSYAHVQLVLAELGRHPDGARFRRLSQELEAIAAKHDGALVW